MEQPQGGGPGPGPPDPGIGTDERIVVVKDLQPPQPQGTEGEATRAGTEQQGLSDGEQNEKVKGHPKGRVATKTRREKRQQRTK
ncbi:hypothetical protein PF011_g31634 [Phytophthora fragariae]|uniref:Uncharacterized protein n=1 Tax=Phytophthora fragariae TaxID=53985 RepID=A0A6A3GC29_9STRA|nr:hypothetical protein PF009_g32274 [Phytophthora fragariae]KAE8955975.1 hypothetical protein PF011_g31634 [Phytophthora fragariae]